MKIGSDCRGECIDCVINYIGGCLAGHGDDDFTPMTIEAAKRIIANEKGYYNSYRINRANEWLEKVRKI